jgi:hypothetical protein
MIARVELLTHDDEQDSKHDKAHDLDGLPSPGVNKEESDPVARNETGKRENDVADTSIVEGVIDLAGAAGLGTTETDSVEDDTRVETKTVESDLEAEIENEFLLNQRKNTDI